jgi:hypothetical protein
LPPFGRPAFLAVLSLPEQKLFYRLAQWI